MVRSARDFLESSNVCWDLKIGQIHSPQDAHFRCEKYRKDLPNYATAMMFCVQKESNNLCWFENQ